jgi:threonyl-tRNA synthetase
LIEHCSGNFPLWLSPEQFIILPISEKFHEYAEKVSQLLKNYDICGPIDKRAETTSRKIRDAEVSKIPFIIVVGEREEAENKITVRKHGGENIGSIETEQFISIVQKEIKELITFIN